jgi:uncharacterized protein
MPSPDHDGAIAYALNRLRSELSPKLTYHNAWHTECDVLPAAVQLARLSDLPEADLQLLRVAAAYHDIGFITTHLEHERRSAELAAQVLPRYGFTAEELERIVGMIMATRLPQRPRNLAEQIMADADLDVLGRADFLARHRALRQELAALGQPMTDQQWLAAQSRFLQQHSYFTPAAQSLRMAEQRANLARLRAYL